MTFILPALLAGLALTALPVLLHLIMRQQPKHVLFPAFRFLQQRLRTNQRKLRLRHLLLLALRILLITLMVLALARPRVFSERLNLTGGQPVAAVFVVDVSPSMEYAVAGKSRLDEAKQRVGELVGELAEGSRVALIDTADVAGDWAQTNAEVQERLKLLSIKPGSVSVTEALAGAYRLFQKLDAGEAGGAGSVGEEAALPRVVYVLSDRTPASWDPGRVPDLAAQRDRLTAPATAVYVDVGVDKPTDLAIVDVEPQRTAVPKNQPVVLKATVRATGQAFDTQIVCRFDGDKVDTKPVRLAAGESRVIEFRRADLGLGYHQAEVTLATNDSLPFNNARFVTVEVRGPRQVLIITPGEEEERMYRANFYALHLALQKGEMFAPETKTVRDVAGLPPKELAKYEVICLLSVPRPDEPAGDGLWEKLLPYVRDGGKLAVFLGGSEALKEQYGTPKAQQLMPAQLLSFEKVPPKPDQEDGIPWAEGGYQHPLMARFREWAQSGTVDFIRDRPRTRVYWKVKPAEGAPVIASYDNGDPALVERQFDPPTGRGRVLLFTSPFDARRDPRDRPFNNYLQSSFFLVMTNEALRYLAGDLEDAVLNFRCGRDVPVPLPAAPRYPLYRLTGPGVGSDDAVRPPEKGNDLTVRATGTAGNFTVVGVDGPWSAKFSLNPPAAESQLDRVPVEQVEQLLGPGSVVTLGTAKSLKDLLQTKFNQPVELFAWLMGLLLLALAVENFLANKFYRKPAAEEPPKPAGDSLD